MAGPCRSGLSTYISPSLAVIVRARTVWADGNARSFSISIESEHLPCSISPFGQAAAGLDQPVSGSLSICRDQCARRSKNCECGTSGVFCSYPAISSPAEKRHHGKAFGSRAVQQMIYHNFGRMKGYCPFSAGRVWCNDNAKDIRFCIRFWLSLALWKTEHRLGIENADHSGGPTCRLRDVCGWPGLRTFSVPPCKAVR